MQRLQWQGRWLYNRSGGLYNFRARFWSPQLGAFLQLDQYQFLSSGGTLWSWPGQNPFRWRDPSGRDGFSSSELGTPEELADPAYRDGMLRGAGWGLLASPFVAVAMFAAEVELGVVALRTALGFSASPAARLAGAGLGALAGGAKSCGDAEAGIRGAAKGAQGFGSFVAGGRTPTASELAADALRQGFTAQKSVGGPLKFLDHNGVIRLTIKQGSTRAPGSGFAHAEFRNAAGERVDAIGNAVTRNSPANHTPIDFDLWTWVQ